MVLSFAVIRVGWMIIAVQRSSIFHIIYPSGFKRGESIAGGKYGSPVAP
jgi:hypothetical protein